MLSMQLDSRPSAMTEWSMMIELNTMKFFVKVLWNTFQFLLSRSKQLIKDAILGNDFLKNLDSTQVREIVDCMYEKRIKQGNYIIREGDAGQHVYVSAGKYPVTDVKCFDNPDHETQTLWN